MKASVTAKFVKANGNASKQREPEQVQNRETFASAAHSFQQPLQPPHRQAQPARSVASRANWLCNRRVCHERWLRSAAHNACANEKLVMASCVVRSRGTFVTRLQMHWMAIVRYVLVHCLLIHSRQRPPDVATYSADAVCRSGFNKSIAVLCVRLRLGIQTFICSYVPQNMVQYQSKLS